MIPLIDNADDGVIVFIVVTDFVVVIGAAVVFAVVNDRSVVGIVRIVGTYRKIIVTIKKK